MKRLSMLLVMAVVIFTHTITAQTPPPTEGLTYLFRDDKAYVGCQEGHSWAKEVFLGEAVTIPPTATNSKGESFPVCGFIQITKTTKYGDTDEIPSGFVLPVIFNIPPTFTEFMRESYVAEYDGTKVYTFSSSFLDYYRSNPALANKLQQINVIGDDGEFTSYEGVLYSKITDSGSTEKTRLVMLPPAYPSKLTVAPNCTQIMSEVGKGSNLSELVLPNTLTAIGSQAFAECPNLTKITIADQSAPSNIKKLGDITHPTVPKNGVNDEAFKNCTALSDITLPDALISIGKEAFSGCTALTSFYIPRNMVTIASTAFANCPALSEFIVPEDARYFESNNGILYSKGLETLITAPFHTLSCTVPAATRHIEANAFSNNTYLRSVTFSEGLESIGEEAFINCDKLTDISLPSTLKSIGKKAFYLTIGEVSPNRTISLPDALTTIPEQAFCGNTITSIHFGNAIESIENEAFLYVTWAEGIDIDLPLTLRHIGNSAFYVDGRIITQPVAIPRLQFANLQSIGPSALTAFVPAEISCGIWTPPVCGKAPFASQAYSTSKLYVPDGAQELYYTTAPWSNFIYVEGREFSGVSDIAADSDIDVRVSGDRLLITVADGTPVQVFSTDGRRVHAASSSTSVELPAGIYIVRAGNTSRKVRL